MRTMNPTEAKIKELVEIEEVMCCLDQHATHETAAGAVYLTWYAKLIGLLDEELREWNADPSVGIGKAMGGTQQISRCDKASTPYHTDADGPCEVYTTHWHSHPENELLCDLHIQMALDAQEAAAERAKYFEAKAKGEDV
jgi:hypothetical protein